MKIYSKQLLKEAERDLGIYAQFVRGQNITVKNCWHFYTDGSAAESMFYDCEDFRQGTNRISVVASNYEILILAYVLMDTHVHFVLYGSFDECNKFVHEYMRRTSMVISARHSSLHSLQHVPIGYQAIDNDWYLKKAICYTIKNPVEAGMHYNPYDYPWSSAALYFRESGIWTSPSWINIIPNMGKVADFCNRKQENILNTRHIANSDLLMIGDMIFPGEFVAYELVERIFKTHKAYTKIMFTTKDEDIESRGGVISSLTIPIQEMRILKNKLCKEMFGTDSSKNLDMRQRVMLARKLKARYNSSTKQIARICGLVYNEVKGMI